MAERLAEGPPVFVPRLNSLFSERDVENAIIMAIRRLGYNEPTSEQSQVLQAFLRGKNVLVCLPTGTGKSLSYASLLRELAKSLGYLCSDCLHIHT